MDRILIVDDDDDTAVLLRDSLRKLSLSRLGNVDFALHSHRFFREASVVALSEQPEFRQRFAVAAPGLVFQASLECRGSVEKSETSNRTRAAGVTLYGTDDRLWSLLANEGVYCPSESIVLNSRLADELRARAGDEVTLWVELPATIPRDTLLGGQEDQTTQEIRLYVQGVLPDSIGAGRFDLQPSQQFPKVAFVGLQMLQKALNEFVELPFTLCRNEPHWVPPLRMAVKELLDREKHPFYANAQAEFFLARQGGRTVGRIAAIINKPQPSALSNVAFGGPDLDTLYVTAGDKVFRRLVRRRGVFPWQPVKPPPPRL